jgi:hypothetical protein
MSGEESVWERLKREILEKEEKVRRSKWFLPALLVVALALIPIVYAVAISNVLQLTPPGGTEVVPPTQQAPPVTISMSPAPPIFGANITAGAWRNTTLTVNNPQQKTMYLKILFYFNETPSADWVTVLLDGYSPSNIVVNGNNIVLTHYLGNPTYTSFPLKIRISPNLSKVKILDAKVWIDDSASSSSP